MAQTILTAEEQAACCRDYKHGLARRDALFASVQGLIHKIAYEMIGHNADVEIDDLVQEAQFATMDAMKWFDESRGFKFTTYLGDCVRRRLCRHLSDPRNRSVDRRLNQAKQRPVDSTDSASGSCVPADNNLIKRRKRKENLQEPLEAITDERTEQQSRESIARLAERLDPFEQAVIRLRYGLDGSSPESVREVAESLGCRPSQVRMIEQAALQKMRSAIPEPSNN